MIARRTLTLGLVMLSACSVTWGVPTTYLIHDNAKEAALELPRVLSEYGFQPGPQNDRAFQFTLTRIPDMGTLKDVQVLIQDWSKEKKTPIQLREAQMVFSSVEGIGTARIQLRGECTAGASVFLDLGGREVVPAELVGADGDQWRAGVEEAALVRLEERSGWVYGVIVKDGAKQYMKLNVLSSKPSEKIDIDELPSDSPLRRQ